MKTHGIHDKINALFGSKRKLSPKFASDTTTGGESIPGFVSTLGTSVHHMTNVKGRVASAATDSAAMANTSRLSRISSAWENWVARSVTYYCIASFVRFYRRVRNNWRDI